MANTSHWRKRYGKGRDQEYKIMKKLREQGYIAFRSAGSHGMFDVIGIHTGKKIIQMIQSKPTGFSKPEIQRLKDEAKEVAGVYMVAFRLITDVKAV